MEKRPRGRPRKSAIPSGDPIILTGADQSGDFSGDNGDSVASAGAGGEQLVIDPAAFIGGNDSGGSGDGTARGGSGKRRGRPSKKAANPVNVSGVEKILFSLHGMAASFLKAPVLAIDQTEAHLLAEAGMEVAKHYPILEAVSEKGAAWANLAMALGMVYGPRVMVARMNKSKAAAEAPTADQANVAPFGMAA